MTSDKSNLWRWNNLRISTGKWNCITVQKKDKMEAIACRVDTPGTVPSVRGVFEPVLGG